MELKEGMYLRFRGMINKVLELEDNYIVFDNNWYDDWADEISSMKIDQFIQEYDPVCNEDLTELIEVGDYINGHKVEKIWEDADAVRFAGCNYIWEITDKDIKTVVTKEQFKNVSYKVQL